MLLSSAFHATARPLRANRTCVEEQLLHNAACDAMGLSEFFLGGCANCARTHPSKHASVCCIGRSGSEVEHNDST